MKPRPHRPQCNIKTKRPTPIGASPQPPGSGSTDEQATFETQNDGTVTQRSRSDPKHPNFHRSLPTRLDQLSELRTALAIWLTQQNSDVDVCDDVLLAATEACTNSIEHAYLAAPTGHLTVEVTAQDHQLVLTVVDRGTWRTPTPTNQDRGRSMAIMESVAERFTRTSGPDGTTIDMVFAKRPKSAD